MTLAPKDELKMQLLEAIQNNEFILFYQPQFNVLTSQFEGVEALIRWQHPKRGFLLPAMFIPEAEKTGLIVPIGEWVLRSACLQNKAWQDKGLPPIRMAVNIAEKQIHDPAFVDLVRDILQETKMEPKYLELELTENIIIHEKKIIETIHALKKLGVHIALDDFGTGYSSITSLKKIPIDRLKIDRTYIQNMQTKKDDAAIMRAIIGLATDLNIQVLAEGVETLKQFQMLSSQKCEEIQGFYFSEPLPAEEVEKFLVLHQNDRFI